MKAQTLTILDTMDMITNETKKSCPAQVIENTAFRHDRHDGHVSDDATVLHARTYLDNRKIVSNRVRLCHSGDISKVYAFPIVSEPLDFAA